MDDATRVTYRVQAYFQPHGETPGEWVSLGRANDHRRPREFDTIDAAKMRMRVLVADHIRIVKVTTTERVEEVA